MVDAMPSQDGSGGSRGRVYLEPDGTVTIVDAFGSLARTELALAPTAGLRARRERDGTLTAVDADGRPAVPQPHLADVDPRTGDPLVDVIVLHPLTRRPLVDATGNFVSVPRDDPEALAPPEPPS